MAREAASTTLQHRAFPALMDIPVVVTRSLRTAAPGDPEDLFRRSPDAILGWDWHLDSLRHVHLPVVGLALGQTRELYKNDIANARLIGAITNNAARAEAIISSYYARLAEVRRRIDKARAAVRHPPRALHASVRNERLYIEAEPFSQAIALQAAGADTSAFRPAGLTDVEQLLIWDPEVIILSCCYGDNISPSAFYRDPRFQALAAVRERRIYKEPAGIAGMDGLLEWPFLVEWMAEVLYPEQMVMSFRSDLLEMYWAVFQYRPSDNELDEILFLNENRDSVGYERFARDQR
jgi:iron complex transport system substrate-binding protein